MIEALFEIFGELLFQVVFSLLGEVFSGAIGAGFTKASQIRLPPAIKAVLYLLVGAGLGWVSLKIFPHSFSKTLDTRVAILIGSPLFCGLSMGLIKAWRKEFRKQILDPAGFIYGVLFAAPISIARFIWARPS